MNIDAAKSIPLDELLQRLGYQPTKQQGGRLWYKSPFRDERTASFVLSKDGHAWFDHGEGVGGNIIDLAMRLGDCRDVPAALSWLDDATGHMAMTIPTIRQRLPVTPEPPAYSLTAAKPFTVWRGRSYTAAASYLAAQRGIDPERFAPYLHDVTYAGRDGKARYGFGMPTINGGHEVRRSGDWAKLSVGHKTVSAFYADRANAPWHTFYSLMDFGTFLTIDRPPVGAYNYLILNGDAMIGQHDDGPERLGLAEQFLETVPVGHMIHYPHSDASGQRAYHHLLSYLVNRDWQGGDRAHLYEGHKDWNEKHKADKGIKPVPQVAIKPAPGNALKQTPKF